MNGIKREKLATLPVIDGPGKDASSNSLLFDENTVSFLVLIDGNEVRIEAVVFGMVMNDKPWIRCKFDLTGKILSGEFAGKHYIAYMNLGIRSRKGVLVILGEPVKDGVTLTEEEVQVEESLRDMAEFEDSMAEQAAREHGDFCRELARETVTIGDSPVCHAYEVHE